MGRDRGEGEKDKDSLNGAVTDNYQGDQGPGQVNVRDWRCYAPLTLHKNPPDREPNTRRFRDMAEQSGSTRQGQKSAEGTTMREHPPGDDMDLGTGQGSRGACTQSQDTVQRQARGAESRDKRPRLAGGGCG